MITDKLLNFSHAQDLTQAPAGQDTPSTNSIDFSQARDFGPTEGFKVWVEFPSLPAPASGKLDVKIQVSVDNQNWTTLEELPGIDLSAISPSQPFAVRAKPAFANAPYRYMRLTYNPAQALTSGTVTAGINLDVPARHDYPRNYVA